MCSAFYPDVVVETFVHVVHASAKNVITVSKAGPGSQCSAQILSKVIHPIVGNTRFKAKTFDEALTVIWCMAVTV